MGNENSHLEPQRKGRNAFTLSLDDEELLCTAYDNREAEDEFYYTPTTTESTLEHLKDPDSNNKVEGLEKTWMSNSEKNCWNVQKGSSIETLNRDDEETVEPLCNMLRIPTNDVSFLEKETVIQRHHLSTEAENIQQSSGQSQDLNTDEEYCWTGQDFLHLGKTFTKLLKQKEVIDVEPFKIPQIIGTESSKRVPESTSISTVNHHQNIQKSYEETLAETYPKLSKSLWETFKKLGMPLTLLIPSSTYNSGSITRSVNTDCISTISNNNDFAEVNVSNPVMSFEGGAVLYRNHNELPLLEKNCQLLQQNACPVVEEFSRENNNIIKIPSEVSGASTIQMSSTEHSDNEPQHYAMKRSFSEAFGDVNVPLDFNYIASDENFVISD